MVHRFRALAPLGLLLVTALTAATLFTVSRGRADAAPEAQSHDGAEKGNHLARRPDGEQGVYRVAHRGASGYAPENTLDAVRLGIEQDAHIIETDVHRSKDGVLVVMHDRTLARTTNVEEIFPDRDPWRIADFTYDEIQKLDAGGWFSEKFAGVRVPTFNQVLDTVGRSDAGILVEVKSPSSYPGIGQEVAELLRNHRDWGRTDRPVAVCSFDFSFVREYKQENPRTTVAVIGTPRDDDLREVATYSDMVNPQYGSMDADYIREVQDLGMRSYVWTVDDPDKIREVLDMGVDGVVTNKPDVLRGVLYPRRGAA